MEARPIKPTAIQTSDLLHVRVQKFARQALESRLPPSGESDTFETLALDIARFQFEQSAGFARLVAAHTGQLLSFADIPLLPTDAFRYSRVGVHPKELDVAVFRTSGTTSESGQHPMRTLATKEALALLQAERSLFQNQRRALVVALAPCPSEPPTSSLGHLMEQFMQVFDGRPLSTDPSGGHFDPRAPGRWLSDAGGINVEGLLRAVRLASHRSEAFCLLSTSFALAAALEALDGQKVRVPARTKVMLTGGFKGMRTLLSETDLRAAARSAFGISESNIIGEYGMTELSSQLFQNPKTSLYEPPPWLRVTAVDPATHSPLPQGEIGLAHFLDLANVDSCVSVLTQDLVQVTGDGVKLLGRAPRAIARGCSLPYEGLIRGAEGTVDR